ncbi:MAG: hypothetical protein AUH68_00095 [Gemmatimonadetes bacterium 13_1_40CM_4_69_5]|nr:MAG: hypothetical protein AUH68_00095 [Gemmatimonadetes bacterium 13_1_40CM_4_69_5]
MRAAATRRMRPSGVEQLRQGVALPEQGVAQVLAHHHLDEPAQQGRERAVGPPHAPVFVDDRHALAQRVERRFPLFLRLAHELEEPGVGEHDGRVRGERGEQPDVLGREAAGARVGDEQRPDRDPVGVQRHGGGRVGLDIPQQAGRAAAGVADQLELLAGQGSGEEAGVVPGDSAVLQVGERTHRRGHAQRRDVAGHRGRPGQGEQRAAGLEEAQREAHDLVGDALQLEGIGQDVGQLLQGEQLGEAAVQLVGRAAALALAAQQPRPQVPEQAQDAGERDAEQQVEERTRRGRRGYGPWRACARASTRARSRSSARMAPRLHPSFESPA